MKALRVLANLFRYTDVLLAKVAIVAASNSGYQAKQQAHFVCCGREDDKQINEALEELDTKYGNWEWKEIKRRRRWKWPWQYHRGIKITKLGSGGTVLLRGGTYEVESGVQLPDMPPPLKKQLQELGFKIREK